MIQIRLALTLAGEPVEVCSIVSCAQIFILSQPYLVALASKTNRSRYEAGNMVELFLVIFQSLLLIGVPVSYYPAGGSYLYGLVA
jgi:hypothetical protein